MIIDRSIYPDVEPPATLQSLADRADSMQRICAAFDFGGYTSGMTSTTHPRITIEPGKCGGKPCIRGMRIRVSDVLELLANGASFEEILADYPCLERDDILAAIAYAAQQTNHVVVEIA
jgi:uncharacterized protein (DUF433 family)